jgi:hypothetical protein
MDAQQKKKIENVANQMDFNSITDKLKGFQSDMMPKMKAMMEEHQRLSKPKSSKNLMINGKHVVASETLDSRVYIKFSTTEEATEYYASLKDISKKETVWQKITKIFK